jgi:HEAT repeat protein
VANLVVKGFTDPNPIIRKAAAQAFEFVGGQPDWRFRGSQGPRNQTVEIIAKTAINDPNMIVRWICVRSLGQTGTFPEIALPALVARLRSDDLEVRIAAAKAIRSFGPLAAPVVEDLGREISHGDADFRIAAMQTAEAIGYACKPIIPLIAENMEHENPKVRIQCAMTLGRFGSAAEAALPTLRRNLRDPDTETRLAASNAILQIEQR